jgi:hypothetical protein
VICNRAAPLIGSLPKAADILGPVMRCAARIAMSSLSSHLPQWLGKRGWEKSEDEYGVRRIKTRPQRWNDALAKHFKPKARR